LQRLHPNASARVTEDVETEPGPIVTAQCHRLTGFLLTQQQQKLSSNTSSRRQHIHPPRRIWSGSGVCIWIWTPDLDYFQNLTGTSLSKETSVVKFSRKSDHSLRRYKPNCGKILHLAMLKNPLKKFLDSDPEMDDFQI